MGNRLAMEGGGFLSVAQEGERVRLEAEREEDGRGLYKAWLTGAGGAGMLLGTLAPEGGKLRLRRVLSRGALEQGGCWPVKGARAVLAFPFAQEGQWYCESQPGRFVRDPVARRQLKGAMLCCRAGGETCLAAPFRTDAPLALEALACLARVELLEGRPHLVWRFDTQGQPKAPVPDQEETCAFKK